MAKTLDPNELIEVVWNDTKQKVNVPRRLISNGNKGALERYLKSSGQLLSEAVPTPADEPEVIVQEIQSNGLIDALSARLSAVENRPDPVAPPSEEALASWSAQAARVSLVHSEMAALADQTVATCEGAAKTANQRIDQLDSQQSAMVETISETLSTVKDESNAAVLATQAEVAGFLVETETDLMKMARDFIRRLLPDVASEWLEKNYLRFCGLSSVTCLQDPIGADETWNKRWLQRQPKVGDTAWVVSADGITFRRYIQGGWSPDAPELNPKIEVVSKHLQIQDASTKVNAPISITQEAKGGGGSTPLAVKSAPAIVGSQTLIGDGSAYSSVLEAAGEYARGARLLLRVVAGDGPNAGDVYYECHDIVADGNGGLNQYETVSAMLGPLGIGITLTLTNGAGSVPSWVTKSPAVSATHTPLITMTIDSNTSGATTLIIEGSILWLLPTDAKHKPLTAAW